MPHLWEERPGESHRRFLQVCYKEPRIPMSWPRERTTIKLLDTQNLKLGKDLGCYPCTLLRHAGIHPSILPSALTWEYKREQQKFLPCWRHTGEPELSQLPW